MNKMQIKNADVQRKIIMKSKKSGGYVHKEFSYRYLKYGNKLSLKTTILKSFSSLMLPEHDERKIRSIVLQEETLLILSFKPRNKILNCCGDKL